MRAALAFVLVCATVGGAAPAGAYRGSPLSVDVDSPSTGLLLPLPIPARVTVEVPDASAVNVCEDPLCSLYRERPLVGGERTIAFEQHPPLGPVFVGEHYLPSLATTPSLPYAGYGMHAVALYGTFVDGAPARATLVRGAHATSATGGLAPLEATSSLDERPAHALAYAAVALAPGALPGDELLASLSRLLELGGAVAIPLSSSERLSSLLAGASLAPLAADPAARLIEVGSQRLITGGERELPASVARVNGGVVVVYDDGQLSESLIADALLAAVPRFKDSARLSYGEPRRSPAASAAGIAVGRPSRPARLLLPLLASLALVLLAVRSRRRGGPLLTRASLVLALGAAAAFLVVPRVLEGEGAHAEIRSYVSYGGATRALEEGAVAVRPSSSGGEVTLRGPVGTTPSAEVRGMEPALPQRVHVEDGGRAVRFPVHGDAVGVASWVRSVALEGLSVRSTADDEWPRDRDTLVVTNRLPFALDDVWVVMRNNELAHAGPVSSGARVSSFAVVALPWDDEVEGADPRALAQRRLAHELRSRCVPHTGAPRAGIACVYGVGTASDGALVGVQVLSP